MGRMDGWLLTRWKMPMAVSPEMNTSSVLLLPSTPFCSCLLKASTPAARAGVKTRSQAVRCAPRGVGWGCGLAGPLAGWAGGPTLQRVRVLQVAREVVAVGVGHQSHPAGGRSGGSAQPGSP
jgi:hypothetical protein